MTSEGKTRSAYEAVERWIEATGLERLAAKQKDAEALFRRRGITFAVYGEGGDPERLIPFDVVPRVLSAAEWAHLEKGVLQRARALNRFIEDVYHDAEIVQAGIVPKHLILQNDAFEPRLKGVRPPGGIYSHIVGVDIVRVGEDEFYVLEDNCRTPSGVSYMLENREIMMRLFPDLFEDVRVAPVDGYAAQLRRVMHSVAPSHPEFGWRARGASLPNVVVMTPGPMNSAFYEHAFLADQMGIDMVEAADLFVENGRVFMRTTQGPYPVDVIYRRIDDDWLDPEFGRPESVLGVPGLIDCYRNGTVALMSAPGAGIADDKAIYTYVPDMVRFYLDEEPILPNVPTWRCGEAEALEHVLANIKDLVVKEVHGSGGYGMLIGPQASPEEIEDFARKLRERPGNYIAQPTLALSASPTLVEQGVAPRHVDLRPFALLGAGIETLMPGGLTRVALREGSLVVNSSQGGGVKDTWVLAK
ncbi:MAG: circularly permuted type 2 ATP-grasp protein [Neomegalonema sp.]|nr:circularly permuted type 2 ATP-grasp protein [Neomegalonema sp.]